MKTLLVIIKQKGQKSKKKIFYNKLQRKPVSTRQFTQPAITWCRSGVFTVNFEHISHIVLVFQLLTSNW